MKRGQKGITLIEILVVCAIVGMLCALTFAALGPVREKGRQRVCASNLHQWGLAYGMYMADYDGMDAEVGVPLTHEQLGLPPGQELVDFLKQYKLWDTAVLHCPSEHPKPVNLMTSYYVGANSDEYNTSAYTQLVAQAGPNLDLLICPMHNVALDFQNQPTWATKWIQSLHIDQHITFHQVPASTNNMTE
jgi:hypothetical protein